MQCSITEFENPATASCRNIDLFERNAANVMRPIDCVFVPRCTGRDYNATLFRALAEIRVQLGE